MANQPDKHSRSILPIPDRPYAGEVRGGPIRLDSARGLDKWILCG